MRKRNCRVEVCFTKDELADLKSKARKANLSVGSFIRSSVQNLEVKEAPSADVINLIVLLKRSGYNLNEVLKKANSIGLLDVPEIRKAVIEVRQATKSILDAYTP